MPFRACARAHGWKVRGQGSCFTVKKMLISCLFFFEFANGFGSFVFLLDLEGSQKPTSGQTLSTRSWIFAALRVHRPHSSTGCWTRRRSHKPRTMPHGSATIHRIASLAVKTFKKSAGQGNTIANLSGAADYQPARIKMQNAQTVNNYI